MQGRHEARDRAVLAEEWFGLLQAPRKRFIVFEKSGHHPLFEKPALFHQVMTDVVLRETYPDR